MYFLKRNDEDFSFQLTNFSTKLPNYVALFGVLPAEVTQAEEDSAYFAWAILVTKVQADTKKSYVGFKNNLRFGVENVSVNPVPETVEVVPVPAEVAPGVQFRFLSLAKRIKAHPNYSSAIGQNLGIENMNQNRIALENVQPVLKLVMRGGLVNLDWKKMGYDGIVIEKDSGSGFEVLDKDMRPNFTDVTPLPPANQSAVWRYRAMYLYSDSRVGNWSDVVSVSVGD